MHKQVDAMAKDLIEDLKAKITNVISISEYSEDIFHSMNTLEWVLQLKPDADDALQIAALGHDIERGIGKRRISASAYETYDEFKQAHALNSAEILVELMEESGIDQGIVDDVAHLVANHESGGDKREEVLKDANVISFFHVCLPLYYDRRGYETTQKRCVWAYRKLPKKLQKHIKKFEFMDPNLLELMNTSIWANNK